MQTGPNGVRPRDALPFALMEKKKAQCPNYKKLQYKDSGVYKLGEADPNAADAGTKCGPGKMCTHGLNVLNSKSTISLSNKNENFM